MTPVEIGLLSVLVIFILLFARMPVAYIMIVVGMSGYAYLVSPKASLSVAASAMYNTFASYSLIVIPLFVWMGYIAFHSGISRRIYDATYKVVGGLPAGLAIASIAACTAFGAICGSTTATAATMSAVALPEMKRYNYDKSLSTATIAAAAILGVMIPPSVIFILYGIATGESIGQLFLAGIFPGMMLMVLFMLVVFIQARLNPDLAPPGPKVPWKEKISAVLNGGIEVIIIFIAVMGGLFGGYFTATEAGGVGAFCTLIVALVRRQLNWEGFVKSLNDSIQISAMIMFLVAGAVLYGRFLAVTGLPAAMASWAVGLPLPPVAVLLVILVIYLILGFFIDALALVLLTVPIFYPVALSLGFDPIWFGVIIVLALGMGVITPPVGANVYVVAGVDKETPVMTIFKGTWPYLLAIFGCIALMIIFPQIALFLPELAK
ncbi:TRAP transporter large permease [Candidatus Contubernalis alkaliaceticus]|uniref:TRAP transporter large permease n=1 Tax=Candidatus Contubernalis alkaliaceticus TaxID=338645 RepID=UPI001F4C484E|nr:TRAP transporter large permease [Candidatus Contubernalis alkalaceticus]UNC91468.1 TRAP transporter large permease [Candidatus Contubernalis alkalaceticus]